MFETISKDIQKAESISRAHERLTFTIAAKLRERGYYVVDDTPDGTVKVWRYHNTKLFTASDYAALIEKLFESIPELNW